MVGGLARLCMVGADAMHGVIVFCVFLGLVMDGLWFLCRILMQLNKAKDYTFTLLAKPGLGGFKVMAPAPW